MFFQMARLSVRLAGRNNRQVMRRGTVVTEFALTLPCVLLFFFAAFEFCRFFMLSHTVDNAVYEATRRGIISGATAAEVERTGRQLLATLGVRSADVTITPRAINRDTPELTVEIVVPYNENSFVPPRFFNGVEIRRELTMAREGL